MQRPLVVVDVQRYNVTEYNRFIPSGIASLLKAELFDPILITRFVNTPDSPATRFLDWEHMKPDAFAETPLAPEISSLLGKIPPATEGGIHDLGPGNGAEKRYLVTKNTYSAFSPEFEELLADLELDNTGLYIVGADTESNVLKTALDAFERQIEPMILAEFCGSHRGLGFHERGIDLLKELIGKDRVIMNYMPLRQRWERQKG